jgi:hypothetical protein
MKITLTESEFVNRFLAIRPDNFSREGLRALFDYLGELEREAEDETEFDPIGLCCDWTEYKDAFEAAEAYGWEAPDVPEGEERDDTSDRKALEFLSDQTHAVEFEGGILVLNF